MNLQQVIETVKTCRKKFLQATTEQKDKIKTLIVICLLFFLMILLFVIGLRIDTAYAPPSTPNQEIVIPSPISKDSVKGIGFDLLNPLSILDPIVDGIKSVIQQGIGLFDDFIAYTPNIANNNGQIYGVSGDHINFNVDKFFNLTTSIAWLLLPLIVVINGTYIILVSNPNGILIVKQLGKKVLLFAIGMVALRVAFALAIDLTNAINGYILQQLVGGSSPALSINILHALGIDDTGLTLTLPSDTGIFNIFAQIILWAGLFIALVGLLFQFGMRFFDLLFHILLYPIILLISLIPGGEKFFNEYIEQISKNLFLQPMFLIGVAIVIEFIASQNGAITKLILGLISLVFLNLVPTIINRYSGLIWGFGAVEASRIVNNRVIRPANRYISSAFNKEKPSTTAANFSSVKVNLNLNPQSTNATGNSSTKIK